MKKYITILFLCISLVSFSQKKKSSKAKNDAIEKEMSFMLECSASKAFNSTFELKTDRNLNDYLAFKVCNDEKNKRIIGVVIAYQQRHMSISEVGRIKVNIAPKSLGIAKFYPDLSITESMFNDLFICKYIYSDGTSLRL